MAEPSELERMAHDAPDAKPQGKKKEDTPLDEIVNGAKNAAAIAVGAAAPFVWPFGNGIDNAITALPLALGSTIEDKMQAKPVNFVKAAKESVVGAIINPPLAILFRYINIIRDYVTPAYGLLPGFAAATGALAAGQAVFIGAYTGLNHVIQNWSFKGLYEKFKKDYWPTVKRTWKYVLPLSALNVTVLPYTVIYQTLGVTAQLAYGSLMGFLFRLVGPKAEGTSLKNLAKEANPFAYLASAANVSKNLLLHPFKALYETGKALGSYSAKPSAPAPHPA